MVEEDIFPFSSTVRLIQTQSLSKRSQCTFELSLFMDIVFPREKIHAVSHEANTWGGRVNRSYSNKSLKPMNLLWKCTAFFFKLQLVCVIRSMILEWHIEYFIDCLHALRWPAWHANFSSQKRLCVTLYQAARHDAPRTFPVNKLLRSRGEHRAEVSRAHTHSTHQPPSPDSPSFPLRTAL